MTKLNDPLVTGGDVFDLFPTDSLISPDSSRVVYLADQDTDEVFELYAADPLDTDTDGFSERRRL